jgi:aminoglycoside 6'-N-acetyltransferase I
MSEIIDLDTEDSILVEHLANITFEAFKENAPDWVPTIDLARNQVIAAGSRGKLGRVIMEQGEAAGWIGLIKGKRVWEIHPIAIAIQSQYCGLGHLLVEDVARIAKSAGALTLFAGTSDEVGTTNLFGVDLYVDPGQAIVNIKATGRNPFEFWENAGFTVVGLMPDAEGVGKPAIQLARRL